MIMKYVEKRLRIRRLPSIPPGQVRINPKTMEYLNVNDEIEIVIARKKKLVFKAYSFDEVPENEVWGNEEELRGHGIADYTIATCRAPLKSQEVV